MNPPTHPLNFIDLGLLPWQHCRFTICRLVDFVKYQFDDETSTLVYFNREFTWHFRQKKGSNKQTTHIWVNCPKFSGCSGWRCFGDNDDASWGRSAYSRWLPVLYLCLVICDSDINTCILVKLTWQYIFMKERVDISYIIRFLRGVFCFYFFLLFRSPGVLLRFRPRIGLDESLQDRILTKVRKRLSRQNSTKKCVNPQKIDKKCVNPKKSKILTKCVNVCRDKIRQKSA